MAGNWAAPEFGVFRYLGRVPVDMTSGGLKLDATSRSILD